MHALDLGEHPAELAILFHFPEAHLSEGLGG
jgi:hypothetical protein